MSQDGQCSVIGIIHILNSMLHCFERLNNNFECGKLQEFPDALEILSLVQVLDGILAIFLLEERLEI